MPQSSTPIASRGNPDGQNQAGTGAASGLRGSLSVLRRRKFIVLAPICAVPLVAVALSLLQSSLYTATTDVLLNRQTPAGSLGRGEGTAVLQAADFERTVQTQVEIARSAVVANRTLDASFGGEGTASDFLKRSEVQSSGDSDLLRFTVEDGDPARTKSLAREYAVQYIRRRQELANAGIQRALRRLRMRIAELRSRGQERLGTRLVSARQELETLEALQAGDAVIVRSSIEARKVRPRPLRNAILGLMVGLVMGVALAFLRDSLDRGVGSAEGVSEALGLPILGRIRVPPRSVRERKSLVMLDLPDGPEAEDFRILRANLHFANVSARAETILFASAVAAEGKSTTVANLAVAYARAGKRVVLLDFDLRQPSIADLFNLPASAGVAAVVSGETALDEALHPIELAIGDPEEARAEAPPDGSLHVLPAGPAPASIGEFIMSDATLDVIEQLRGMSDLVLIDAPPLLAVGDVMAIIEQLDALVLVIRPDRVSSDTLGEMKRALELIPTPTLGVAITGADVEDGYEARHYGHSEVKVSRPRALFR